MVRKRLFTLGLSTIAIMSLLTGCNHTIPLLETAPTESSTETSVKPSSEIVLTADYIITNAKIYTEDAVEPWAEAFAVKDGKFVYVGADNTDELNALKIDTLKIFYDGTNELGTSMLVDGTVENPDYHGEDHMFANADETYTMIKKANEAGVDIHFHLVGDLAFRQVCDAVEKLKGEIGELDIQVEMCHCEYVNPADQKRPAELGIILNWTPQWSGGYFGEGAKEHLGEERFDHMYDFNPMIKSGATVTYGSDIYSWDEEQRANPYFGMQTAMTKVDIESPLEDEDGNPKARASKDAELSLEDLLRGYTIDAAKQLRIDDVTGSISSGKAANYNVYDKNLFEIEKDSFKDVLPESVVFEGREINQN